jgi:hypothetical protein
MEYEPMAIKAIEVVDTNSLGEPEGIISNSYKPGQEI